MEIHLDRKLAERRIFPAVNIERSGTRHEELLLDEKFMKKITTLHRMLGLLDGEERVTLMIDKLSKTKNNAEFLDSLSAGA